MFAFWRARKRERLTQRPFPREWEAILEAKLSFEADYLPDERERFRTHLKVFVWEKHWVGARGLQVTEEMKVIIAGCAARLSHNLDLHVYDRLSEIVIYPSHYVHAGRDAIIYGEAHHWGTIVLSWDAVRHGLVNPHDGHDTTLHELAHVLDAADGWFDGTPELHQGRDYQAWSAVLGRAYAQLQRSPQRGIVRAYGATNEAEFFAVSTEAFFERPEALKRDDPQLYEQLKRFYRSDPATRHARHARHARQGRDASQATQATPGLGSGLGSGLGAGRVRRRRR